MNCIVKINRKHGDIYLPKSVYEEIKTNKMFITCFSKKTSYGYYFQCMVCKKEKSKITFRMSLAKYILKNTDKNKVVDHIDGNTLNNCISNLRLVDYSKNGANRKKGLSTKSKYKGVYIKRGKFYASIKKSGKRYSCSNFNTEEEAAMAYDYLANILFGEYAKLNFT